MENSVENPFDELPEALVDEMLSETKELSAKLSDSLREIQVNKSVLRKALLDRGILKKDSDIISSLTNPTCVGVDGSYTSNKLLSAEITAFAAVSVEGLTPPSEVRHWEKPHHLSKILTLKHNEDTLSVARAIMMTMELELAFKSPHDIVFLDGSLTTHFIYFNQALNKVDSVDPVLAKIFKERLAICLKYYKEILTSTRSDKIFVGVPKYTTKNEVVGLLNLSGGYEDRGLLTFLLDAGEFTNPLPLQKEQGQEWHLKKLGDKEADNLVPEIINAIKELQVVYYRPRNFMPAIRMEMSKSVSLNIHRLAILLEGTRNQCIGAGIMEPYPTYMADRMVKHLSTALPAIRKTATQDIAEKWDQDIGDVFLAMHNYRS